MKFTLTIPEFVAETMISANRTIAQIRAIEQKKGTQLLTSWFTPRQIKILSERDGGWDHDLAITIRRIKMFGGGMTVIATIKSAFHDGMHEQRTFHEPNRIEIKMRGWVWEWRDGWKQPLLQETPGKYRLVPSRYRHRGPKGSWSYATLNGLQKAGIFPVKPRG